MRTVVLITYLMVISEGRTKKYGVNVSGWYTQEKEFPFAAFLNIQCLSYSRKPSISWRCGSSIVNQYILLTAAHCVDPETCDDLVISAIAGNPDRLKGIISSAYSYLLHEDYNNTSNFASDIALVRLKSPLKFNAKVNRVAIMQHPPYHEEAVIAGWGQVHPSINVLSEDLKYMTQFVWRKEACTGTVEDIKRGTFCSSSNNTGFVLNGDTGGALIVRGYIQIGICSYIKPKSTKTIIIFTDVGYYYNWIKDKVNTIICGNK